MASNADRARRWMDRALGRAERDLSGGNVFYDGDTIFSYGYHFPMATVMRDGHEQPSWVLVNGDRFSVSTSRHQSEVRHQVMRSGLPSIIVPFSALNAAEIAPNSIEIVEVRPDRTEEIHRSTDVAPSDREGALWACLGSSEQRHWDAEPNAPVRWTEDGNRAVELGTDGRWHWVESRHWLGDSTFRAKVRGKRERRRFLSSFDYQEREPLYFLCELPRSSSADSVEQAYEDLKPPQVKAAEAQVRTVTRQGDMFAIPTTFSTREVKEMTPHGKGRIVKRPRLGLLGTNHTASEVIFATKGRVYARGLLYHQPGAFRNPDHARRKMGDGRTWHLLAKNTVPTQDTPTRERTLV